MASKQDTEVVQSIITSLNVMREEANRGLAYGDDESLVPVLTTLNEDIVKHSQVMQSWLNEAMKPTDAPPSDGGSADASTTQP